MNDTNSNGFKNPKGALTFRILAIGIILYILADLWLAFVKGGEGAPGLTFIAAATAILGGGAVLVAILTWKAWKKDTEDKENKEDA